MKTKAYLAGQTSEYEKNGYVVFSASAAIKKLKEISSIPVK